MRESVLSHSETINFAGIHVDRREDELTSTIDGFCWPTVSHHLLPTSAVHTPYCAPFSLSPLAHPYATIIIPRNAASKCQRIWYNETEVLADAFWTVSAAETCPGNGEFNTDVHSYPLLPYWSQPFLHDGPSDPSIRSMVLELRWERVTWYPQGDAGRGWGWDKSDTRKRAGVSRGKLQRHRCTGIAGMVGIFREVFGKMRQWLRETGRIIFMNSVSVGKPSAVWSLAKIRSRRSLRYSGADFIMEKSCYSILINNGGRARYGDENFKRWLFNIAI